MATINAVNTSLSGQTGTGSFVGSTSPTLVTPTIGVATATSVNKMAITAPATSSTLAVADGKTLTVSNTLTLTGTDSSSVDFGGGGTVLYNATGVVVQSVSSANIAGSTTTSTTFVDVTSASLAITPTSASNKVLVIFTWLATTAVVAATNTSLATQILRTATVIPTGTQQTFAVATSTIGASLFCQASFCFLDSPATTSATTYKLQQKSSIGTQTVSCQNVTITLMEIKA